jgi:hypothetical protein
MELNITERSKALFLAYAKDAGNWSGTPLVGGNVGASAEDRGNLTQLKQAGLLTTDRMDGHLWVHFSDLGREYAREYGVEIRD